MLYIQGNSYIITYSKFLCVNVAHKYFFSAFESICVPSIYILIAWFHQNFLHYYNATCLWGKKCCIHCIDDFSGLDFSSFISTGNMCNLCQWKRKLSPQNNKKISLLLMKTRNLKMKKCALKISAYKHAC